MDIENVTVEQTVCFPGNRFMVCFPKKLLVNVDKIKKNTS